MFQCHFVCDVCQRVLDPIDDQRYVLRITSANGPADAPPIDDDRDYLEEINDILESGGTFDEGAADEQLPDEQRDHFDLCADCRERFALDPLCRRIVPALDFSEN